MSFWKKCLSMLVLSWGQGPGLSYLYDRTTNEAPMAYPEFAPAMMFAPRPQRLLRLRTPVNGWIGNATICVTALPPLLNAPLSQTCERTWPWWPGHSAQFENTRKHQNHDVKTPFTLTMALKCFSPYMQKRYVTMACPMAEKAIAVLDCGTAFKQFFSTMSVSYCGKKGLSFYNYIDSQTVP